LTEYVEHKNLLRFSAGTFPSLVHDKHHAKAQDEISVGLIDWAARIF